MAQVVLGGAPVVHIGGPGPQGSLTLGLTSVTVNAVDEAAIMVGRIYTEDGASHTIDTTGSSSLGWRAGTVTFANAGTTVKVGLAAVDMAAGPPARAVNVAGVITLDVSKSLVGGGGGITNNAWLEHVPDAGTKAIANGDLVAFCVQMTARGGTDSVAVSSGDTALPAAVPTVTGFLSAAYTTQNSLPNAVITFSDGTLGFFYGGTVFSTVSTTQLWNSGSSPNEYGNFFKMPSPVTIYGLRANCSITGNTDFVLYSDPLGTPVAERTVSIDLNTVGTTGVGRLCEVLFATPYAAVANQPLGLIMKPTSVTDISSYYKTFNVAAHQKSEMLGTNGYAISRASGAFAAVNSSKDRFAIGLLVGAFPSDASSPTYVLGV